MFTRGVSALNSSTTALAAGATFTGAAEDVHRFESAIVACKTDQAGSLYVDFSTDGNNWDSTLTFSIAASVNEVHRITITRRYFRVRVTNTSGSAQTYMRLQSMVTAGQALTSPLSGSIQSDADALIAKAIGFGRTDSGNFAEAAYTAEGHQEVAIHGPLLPFGSIHAETVGQVCQFDAVYGLNSQLTDGGATSGSGSVTASNSSFVLASGTTIYSQAVLQSRKRIRYRPGQGVIARFTAQYTTGVASSYQVAGVGNAEDGFYFGYVGTQFGILYVNRGVREVRTLTVTTASSTNENITITLNGTAYTVAVTNSGNIQRTVWEIAQGTYAGWRVDVVGATVRFINNSAGAKNTGAYTLAGTTAVGTFAQTKAGAASTDTFVPSSSFNVDTLDGTGSSGFTLDPTKYNVFQINLQYLGAGAISFFVEHAPTGNNATWILCHVFRFPNTLTDTTIGNPGFPFTAAVYSAGSTTNLTMKTASVSLGIEGRKFMQGPRFSYYNQLTTVGSANYQALFTIMNSRYYASRSNQAVINLISVSGALKHTSPCIYYLIRNGTLAGNPNFSSYDTTSCSLLDTSATTVTFSNNRQVLWSGHLGDTGDLDHHFSPSDLEEFTLQPGEWVTLAAKAVTGSPSYVTGSINTREDQ